jgi:hypothetical protein
MATAMVSSQARMRPQSPMLTTSETAPMVQKLVLLAKKPNTKPRPKPHQTTVLYIPSNSSGMVCSPSGDPPAFHRYGPALGR